jgi:hypothetical protein
VITVYLSGAYSSDPMGNTIDAIRTADRLIDHGFAPFVPHSMYHWWNDMAPRGYDDWLAQCLVWVPRCDCLLRMPSVSPGGDREVMKAKTTGIPVFYSERELFQWRDALIAGLIGSI